MKFTYKFILSFLLLNFSSYSTENLSVGILVPSKESFKDEISLTQKEFNEVLKDNFTVKSSLIKEFSNPTELRNSFLTLERNSDVIISLDPISSKYLNKLKSNKLLLTPFTFEPDLLKSAQTFHKIYPFKSVTLITSKFSKDKILSLQKNLKKEFNIFVKVEYLENSIFIDTDAVIIYNPLKKNQNVVLDIIKKSLNTNRPVFAIDSQEYVEKGALASIIPSENDIKALRKSALTTEKKFSNEEFLIFKDQKITSEDQLVFNAYSSKILNVYPPANLLAKSTKIGSIYQGEESLSFVNSLNLALNNNLNLKSQQDLLNSQAYDPKLARAKYRPNLGLFSEYQNVNDTISSVNIYDAENTLRGGLEFKQVLFNDETFNNINIQDIIYELNKEKYLREEINTVFFAASTYLNVLRYFSTLHVREYNLKLTKEFLEIAKNRRDVGTSDSSDVFLFESLYADALTKIKYTEGNLENTQRKLNQILNLPLDSKFKYDDLKSSDNLFLSSNKCFLNILENPFKLQEFMDTIISSYIANVPEVKSINYQIKSKEIELGVTSRKHFLPEIALQGRVYSDLTDPWGEYKNNKDKEDYWQLGISATLPLYSGGEISYQKEKVAAQLNSLQKEKEAIIENISQLISSKITDISTAYENQRNAKVSTESANKSLDLVTDNYTNGTVSIANLIDSQNNLISAQEQEVIANYDFLLSLLDLERIIGQYYFSLPSQKKQNLINKIDSIQGGYTYEK